MLIIRCDAHPGTQLAKHLSSASCLGGKEHLLRQNRTPLPKGGYAMDQLITQLTQEAGLTEAQARQAVQIVLGFVRSNLPPSLASQVDNILSSQGVQGIGGITGQVQGTVGDVLGGTLPPA